ncbi:hypothetical protein WA158_008183 [Blastocystis sp. Blastoise]
MEKSESIDSSFKKGHFSDCLQILQSKELASYIIINPSLSILEEYSVIQYTTLYLSLLTENIQLASSLYIQFLHTLMFLSLSIPYTSYSSYIYIPDSIYIQLLTIYIKSPLFTYILFPLVYLVYMQITQETLPNCLSLFSSLYNCSYIQSHPISLSLLHFIIVSYIHLNNREKSIEWIQIGIKRSSSFSIYIYLLETSISMSTVSLSFSQTYPSISAYITYQQMNIHKSIEYLILSLSPSKSPSLVFLCSLYNIALLYYLQKDYISEEYYLSLLYTQLNQSSPFLFNTFFYFSLLSSSSSSLFSSSVLPICSSNPKFILSVSSIYLQLIRCQLRNNHYEKAYKYIKELINSDTSSIINNGIISDLQIEINRCTCLILLKRQKEAENQLRQLLVTYNSYIPLYNLCLSIFTTQNQRSIQALIIWMKYKHKQIYIDINQLEKELGNISKQIYSSNTDIAIVYTEHGWS